MCLEYVQCFIASEGNADLVWAKPSFPGNCPGEMIGSEVPWWGWAGRGWDDCLGKGAIYVFWDFSFFDSQNQMELAPLPAGAGRQADTNVQTMICIRRRHIISKRRNFCRILVKLNDMCGIQNFIRE